MAFKLAIQPSVAMAWKAIRNYRWKMVGRGRARDQWDLQCRAAYLRGLLLGPKNVGVRS